MEKSEDLYKNKKPRSQWKDRYIYTMAGLTGGLAGLHNFYLKRWKSGGGQVLLSIVWITLLSLQFPVLAVACCVAEWLWINLEIFLVRHDPDGDLMNDEARPLRLLLIFVFWLSFVILPLLLVLYVKNG